MNDLTPRSQMSSQPTAHYFNLLDRAASFLILGTLLTVFGGWATLDGWTLSSPALDCLGIALLAVGIGLIVLQIVSPGAYALTVYDDRLEFMPNRRDRITFTRDQIQFIRIDPALSGIRATTIIQTKERPILFDSKITGYNDLLRELAVFGGHPLEAPARIEPSPEDGLKVVKITIFASIIFAVSRVESTVRTPWRNSFWGLKGVDLALDLVTLVILTALIWRYLNLLK